MEKINLKSINKIMSVQDDSENMYNTNIKNSLTNRSITDECFTERNIEDLDKGKVIVIFGSTIKDIVNDFEKSEKLKEKDRKKEKEKTGDLKTNTNTRSPLKNKGGKDLSGTAQSFESTKLSAGMKSLELTGKSYNFSQPTEDLPVKIFETRSIPKLDFIEYIERLFSRCQPEIPTFICAFIYMDRLFNTQEVFPKKNNIHK